MLRQHEIRVIYEEGVEAVTETIRHLYEMIETDDERIHRLVASATAAHLDKIKQLTARISRLEEELSNRARQVHQLNQQIKDLTKQLKAAQAQTQVAREAHLATVIKNSQNSSLPPSQDPRKRTKSLREKSGNLVEGVGGQVGHRGATKEMVAKPDHLVIHAPESCSLCGSSLNGAEVKASERRQLHDLPPQRIEVTKHQSQTKVCVSCGMKNKAKFPAGINAPVQYGEGIRSVATYLIGYQLLPFERCAETMNDLFDCRLLPGTLATISKEGAREMVEPLLLIKEGLRKPAASSKPGCRRTPSCRSSRCSSCSRS